MKFPMPSSSLSVNSARPKKSLGQNFLIDQRIRDKIIASCQLKKEETVLEIGPGKGILTQQLAKQVKHVYAIEKDRQLAAYLRESLTEKNVTIISADVLRYSFDNLPKQLKVVGNLPYNIATPIIEKIINHRKQMHTIYCTVQLEHGLRMIASPNTKSYGSFTCFVKYHADVKKLFTIKNTAFFPKPKVQSCFIRLDFSKLPVLKAHDEELLFKIIRQSFQQRRKTILNSLSSLKDKKETVQLFHDLKIDSQKRAENLRLQDFVRISDLWEI